MSLESKIPDLNLLFLSLRDKNLVKFEEKKIWVLSPTSPPKLCANIQVNWEKLSPVISKNLSTINTEAVRINGAFIHQNIYIESIENANALISLIPNLNIKEFLIAVENQVKDKQYDKLGPLGLFRPENIGKLRGLFDNKDLTVLEHSELIKLFQEVKNAIEKLPPESTDEKDKRHPKVRSLYNALQTDLIKVNETLPFAVPVKGMKHDL